MELVDTCSALRELLVKAKMVSKGRTVEAAGIDLELVRTYAEIARQCQDNRQLGLTPYPFEQGPGVGAFAGGYFEYRHRPLRKDLEEVFKSMFRSRIRTEPY